MALRGGPIGSSFTAEVVPGWRAEEYHHFLTNFLNAGVVKGNGNELAVTANGSPNMTVNVNTGMALISVTTTLLNPNYTFKTWLSNSASVSVNITTAHASLGRIDRIVAKFDPTVDPNGSASNIVSIIAVAGTPSGSPAAPATPANCISLATVSVPGADTQITSDQITDTRTFIDVPATVLPSLARLTDVSAVSSNLASTTNGKGASTVGIEDSSNHFTSTNVEGALGELYTLASASTSGSKFFGSGTDGATNWTSGVNLNPSTEKQYTTSILPVGQTLTVSTVNVPLIIHNTGDVTINGTVDLNGKGGPGGSAGPAAGNGGAGTKGKNLLGESLVDSGDGGIYSSAPPGTSDSGGGGGGASIIASGDDGSNGYNANTKGIGGTIDLSMATKLALLSSIHRGVMCGGGGGGGGGNNTGGVGRTGGAGGGAMVWMIGGNLTLGASSIVRADGIDGTNAVIGDEGSGGGGGGGSVLIIVAGTITNNGATLTAAGGARGGGGGYGGAGAAGKIIIYSISTGTLITSA